MVALMWGTPGVARVFLASLTTLMNFAVETGVREDNPCTGIKRPKLSKEGRLTWSEEDIAAFEARHPVGSSARLALALLLHTGQRLSDVIKLGRQLRAGCVELRQQKTGAALTIPIHGELQSIIAATPSEHLMTQSRKIGRLAVGRL